MSLEILGIAHVNVNCSDLARSTAFYGEFAGLEALAHTHPAPQDGAGFGLEGPVQWDAHMLGDARGLLGTVVDLLEWKQPLPSGRPYAEPNHLGYFRLGFWVPDVDVLYRDLCARGASPFAPPAPLPAWRGEEVGVRALLCRDPDGSVLAFAEQPQSRPQLSHVTVHCSELARSAEWYERVLGLEAARTRRPGPVPGTPLGLEGEVDWEAAFLAQRERASGFGVELLAWRNPRPLGRPYAEAHHLGIYRMALLVEDAQQGYEELRCQGVACEPPVFLDLGPEIPVDGVRAVFFPDPDGTCLELIQNPLPG